MLLKQDKAGDLCHLKKLRFVVVFCRFCKWEAATRKATFLVLDQNLFIEKQKNMQSSMILVLSFINIYPIRICSGSKCSWEWGGLQRQLSQFVLLLSEALIPHILNFMISTEHIIDSFTNSWGCFCGKTNRSHHRPFLFTFDKDVSQFETIFHTWVFLSKLEGEI